MQQHGGGLDITKPKSQLAVELRRPLTGINRQHPGFEELSTGARRGIEPGDLHESVRAQRAMSHETGKNRGLRRLRIACFVHSWVPTRQRGAPVLVQNAGPYLQ
jgi:hypothetical protein